MSRPASQPSRSAADVRPFLAMEVLERAQEIEAAGGDVVHLEVGEPDFPLPPAVEEALAAAARAGHTHYTHSLGIRPLREEIARWYGRRYGVDVAPGRVVVTAGTSGALVLLFAHLLDPGDDVLLPDPGYPCYPNFARAFHGTPRRYPLRAEAGFLPDPAEVARLAGPRTRALFVNSPSNPTARILDRSTLETLAEPGVPLVSDEIYHGLEYGRRAPSVLETPAGERAFVVDGCSKRWAMTGVRIGWLVAPEAAVPALQRLQQNLFVCAGSLAQHAALAALRHADADLERMRAEYARRRRCVIDGLASLDLPVPGEPEGAYYTLFDPREPGGDSLATAHRILEEARVGLAPGVDFGPGGEGLLRLSFAASEDRLREGLARLGRWLASRR